MLTSAYNNNNNDNEIFLKHELTKIAELLGALFGTVSACFVGMFCLQGFSV